MQRCGWLVRSIKYEPLLRFIDSSKVSLKAVLLHNGNVLPSIPVARAFGIKESDDSMKQLLQNTKYDIQVEHLCGPESDCTFTWTAARVH